MPGEFGFIAIINEENGLLEIIQSFDNPHGAAVFRLSDCWATKLEPAVLIFQFQRWSAMQPHAGFMLSRLR